jgi:high-affinity iron transporter
MLPSFLITIREVIEATLIVATILGILVKLNQKKSIKTVWVATATAGLISVLLLVLGSLLGLEIQKLYTGKIEDGVEGVLMIISAVFITWAVFFLHTYFGKYKTNLLQKIKNNVENREQKGLFILVFTAVFREGFEIVLFLSSIYFSSSPVQIFTGFTAGVIGGLVISFALFTATLRTPVYQTFRITSGLLVIFAAGLLARGLHEFAEVGLLPELNKLTLFFIPSQASFAGGVIKAIFGITQHMDILQVVFYLVYVFGMGWWVFLRKNGLLQRSMR